MTEQAGEPKRKRKPITSETPPSDEFLEEACRDFVADAYCENESQSGYACGREGCPHCGGESLPSF